MCRRLQQILRVSASVPLLLLMAGVCAFAQMNTGEVGGIVRDPQGAVVLGAPIEAVETGTQLKYSTKTNEAGEYLLAQLPVGNYELKVTAQGFKQSVQKNIELHAGEKLRQAFTLELGEQSETLTVCVAHANQQ